MNIGAVIGRFQVAELSAGHRFLINKAIESHDRTVVLLGVPKFQGSKRDPLDYDVRARMIQSEFPGVIVLPIHDLHCDEDWSKSVDESILKLFPQAREVVVYGGRDSFIPHYKGEFDTNEVVSKEVYVSGTETRAAIGRNPRFTTDFRAGCIYFVENMFAPVKPTVDIAVIRKGYKKGEIIEVLLGKKPGEKKWRLPGGFVDATDANFQSAACRELTEEVPGIATHGVDTFQYIGNTQILDPRLKGSNAAIMTTLFLVEAAWGNTTAGDDLEMAAWFDLAGAKSEVVGHHKVLIQMVLDHVAGEVRKKK